MPDYASPAFHDRIRLGSWLNAPSSTGSDDRSFVRGIFEALASLGGQFVYHAPIGGGTRMATEGQGEPNPLVETIIRVGSLAVLLYLAASAVVPFLQILLWGVILAVALGPAHDLMSRMLGGSNLRGAIALTLTALVFVLGPSVTIGDALGKTAYRYAHRLREGRVEIPPPPTTVRDWPIVGERVYEGWSRASTDLASVLERSSDTVLMLGRKLLATTGGAVLAVLQFAGSLLLAGFILARREESIRFASALFERLAPDRGAHLLELSEQTVRGVAAGVIGVAIIQSTLVGLGLVVAKVPLAGVWSLLCLVLGIVQLPMGIVVVPIVIYQFSHVPTMQAVLLAAWLLPTMLIDNVLKPILMGRGVEAPMLVIFVGALGGFASSGFIGLFTGAIVLVLAYELLTVWVYGVPEVEAASDRPRV